MFSKFRQNGKPKRRQYLPRWRRRVDNSGNEGDGPLHVLLGISSLTPDECSTATASDASIVLGAPNTKLRTSESATLSLGRPRKTQRSRSTSQNPRNLNNTAMLWAHKIHEPHLQSLISLPQSPKSLKR